MRNIPMWCLSLAFHFVLSAFYHILLETYVFILNCSLHLSVEWKIFENFHSTAQKKKLAIVKAQVFIEECEENKKKVYISSISSIILV